MFSVNILHVFSFQESLLVFRFHVLAPAHSLDVGKFLAHLQTPSESAGT